MPRLLIVEESIIAKGVFKELLDNLDAFEYDMAGSYAEAKKFLSQRRYEYGVVNHILKDAPHGEIISLFNKHYIAPLVFTSEINEDFFDDFEGANIVGYVKKIRYNNEALVVKKLQQLHENKNITVLIVSDSKIYSTYLKHNLTLHNFKVYNAHNTQEAEEKLKLHPETALLIIDTNEVYVNALEIVTFARKQKELESMNILVLREESNSYETSELLHNGANDYLIKEFSRDEFYVRVYQNINKIC